MTKAFLKRIVIFCKDSIMTSRKADTALQPAISLHARSRSTDFVEAGDAVEAGLAECSLGSQIPLRFYASER
jgi:hypothetical protein